MSKQKKWFLFCSVFIYFFFIFFINGLINSIKAYFLILRHTPIRILSSGRARSYIYKITFFVLPIFKVILNKTTINQQQLRNLLLAGLATPIFDDFFDSNDYNSYALNPAIFPNITNHNYQKNEDFQFLFKNLTNQIKFKNEFNQQFNKVIQIQSLSQQQKETISIQELKHLSELKGGESLILYLICADVIPSEAEKALLHQFGYLFQLMDDIYDVSPDKCNNIYTIPIYFDQKPLLLKLLIFRQVKQIILLSKCYHKNIKYILIYIQLLIFFTAFKLSNNELSKNTSRLMMNMNSFCYALNFTFRLKECIIGLSYRN